MLRRGEVAKSKGLLPLTETFVHNIFAFMARHEAIRDGHARQIGLAGIEYTVLISIGHLALDGDVNVKTVADHERIRRAA
jgi:hypothetical protein